MKKLLWSVSVLIIMFLVGCKDKKKNDSTNEGNALHTAAALPDSTIYGVLGEATGMSCIQIITNNGDTLVLNKESEYTGEAGRILGSIDNYSDQFAIVAAEDTQSIRIAINLTQLARSWSNVSDLNDNFFLLSNGSIRHNKNKAEDYTKWSIYNGKLLFTTEKSNKENQQKTTDTLDILKLSKDSLVVIRQNNKITRYYNTK